VGNGIVKNLRSKLSSKSRSVIIQLGRYPNDLESLPRVYMLGLNDIVMGHHNILK